MASHWLPIAALVGAFNLAAYGAFAFDKGRARARGRRVSERTLLLLAALGGSPGAFAARARFRHKTRKQPFTAWLWTIALVQAGALGWWLARLLAAG